MIRIAVCDNEKAVTHKLEVILEENAKKNLIVNQTVDVYNSSLTFMNYLNHYPEFYDLIYLDIEMPEIDGINLARKIRENNRNVIIIYISAHENYCADLFPVFPFRFLKKPIDEDAFAADYAAAYAEISRPEYFFSYHVRGVLYRNPLKDIIYFESSGRNINIVIKNKKEKSEQFRSKLGDLETHLMEHQAQFLRIHQSYLINVNLITEFGFDYVKMFDGAILPISQEKQKHIRREYFNMEKK